MNANPGDHVELKGIGLTGLSGTVVHKGLFGIKVNLDPGQLRGGNSFVTVSKRNITSTRRAA